MIDLLKNDKMDLFWIVYYRLVETNVTPNVYTYSNIINAYCKIGKGEKGIFGNGGQKFQS